MLQFRSVSANLRSAPPVSGQGPQGRPSAPLLILRFRTGPQGFRKRRDYTTLSGPRPSVGGASASAKTHGPSRQDHRDGRGRNQGMESSSVEQGRGAVSAEEERHRAYLTSRHHKSLPLGSNLQTKTSLGSASDGPYITRNRPWPVGAVVCGGDA
jgi:hypothetical protein